MKENKELKELIENYNNIKIPNELDNVINDALNINKHKKNKTYRGTLIAASVCMIILGVNISPVFASTLEKIPVIGNMIKIINFKNYSMNKNGFDISIDIPKVEGLKDKELEYKLNKEFEDEGKKLYDAYLEEMKELESLKVKSREYGKYWYEVINENDKILSLVIYNYYAQGSSNTTRKFYNIDKESETVLTLEGMFEGSDYINIISENIKKQMKERTKEDVYDVYWINGNMDIFKSINKEQGFYINNNNELVICFDKYEVAPGSSGLVEFIIPKEITNKLMK